MGQKKIMKIWQMVIILVLSAGILATMFLPVYKVDGDAIVSMLQTANNKVEDNLDFGALGSLVNDLAGKFLESQKENFEARIEEFEEERDIKISSITPFEIMTHNAQSFFGTEEEEFEEEEGKGENGGEKEDKKEKKKKDTMDDKEEEGSKDAKDDKDAEDDKDSKEEEDQNLESRLEKTYTTVRVAFWLVYLLAFVVMVMAVLGIVLKMSKYLPLAISAIYSVGAMAVFGVGKFMSPSIFADNVSKAEGLFDSGIFAEADKVFGEGLRQAVLAEWITGKMFHDFIGVGFLIGLIFTTLLLIASIVSMFVGNQQAVGTMSRSQGMAGSQRMARNQGIPVNQGMAGSLGMPVNQGKPESQGMPVNQGKTGTQGMAGNQGMSGNQGIAGSSGMPVKQRMPESQGIPATQGMPVNSEMSENQRMPITPEMPVSEGMPGIAVSEGMPREQGMPVTPGMQQRPAMQEQRQVQQVDVRMGQVACTKGVALGKCYSLPQDRKVVIGRNGRNANLVIDYPRVSNVHCSIRYRAVTNTYIVKDHSTNGTFANGIRLRKDATEELPAGSVLQLADGANEITLG